MDISLNLNQQLSQFSISPGDSLLTVLRNNGIFSPKSGGCQQGECGACTILFDGKPINSCQILALQAVGHKIETIEQFGENPEKGWMKNKGFNILQKTFMEAGAIQCGYCTPSMILAAEALLRNNINPTETEIRESLSGVLCRCTGYLKPVEAVLQAAAELRGEKIEKTHYQPVHEEYKVVGRPEQKVDAAKLAQGKPAFALDIEKRDVLVAKILHSPIAHARIKKIDASKARALPGVACVLTWLDIPRVVYSTAGQSDPIPGPLDSFSLDNKVRFVGDRVAFVAAETEDIANQAIKLIEVEYEPLPTVLDSTKSMAPGAPILHDEKEFVNFADSDPYKNLAAKIRIDIGSVDEGFEEADKIFEGDYEVPKVQQVHIEPHAVLTYWDEDDRLVIRTSTQVPFHARRILAPVLGLPIKKIRVIKPRIGGGFGAKQEVLIEDVAAHLTIATGRPVKIEYTREEEFIASRSRHPMRIHMKTGVKRDGTITANEMIVISDTGAYGCHALTVTGNTGHKAMALYVGDGKYRKSPNIRFYADVVYTNHPPAGAYRGYGVPQGFWPVERHMEKIAHDLNMDPIEFRLKNTIRSGELHPFSTAWSEGREPRPEVVDVVGLEECVKQGKIAIGWDQKYHNSAWQASAGKSSLRKGIGIATVMQGTAIPYLDMGGASIKINEDGSFNLLVGATDLGTGSDTVLAQMAAEVLGCSLDDILIYSSDTDFTPFDKGAYASSTTYISGTAVAMAAQKVAAKIKQRAVLIINEKNPDANLTVEDIILKDKKATTKTGYDVSLSEIALASLHHSNQEQIMAVASYYSPVSPPPFAAQFAEVTVDIETGVVIVDRLVMAVDSGVIINPTTASGQIEGGMVQALGYAVCEEMTYDSQGVPQEKDLVKYHIYRSNEMPDLKAIFVNTFEPSHPFGAKAVAEIPLDGVAPAVANAIFNAVGVNIDTCPVTPDKVWKAMQKRG